MNRDLVYTCDVSNARNNLSRNLFLYKRKLVINNANQDHSNTDIELEQRSREIELRSHLTTISWIYNENIIKGFKVSYQCNYSMTQKSITYLADAQKLKQLKQLQKILYNHILYSMGNILNDTQTLIIIISLKVPLFKRKMSKQRYSIQAKQISKYVQTETGELKIVKMAKINDQVDQITISVKAPAGFKDFDVELSKLQKYKSILEIDEVYKDSNEIIFVMKYCRGGTLYNYLVERNNALEIEETKYIMKRLLKGVKHLHKLGIIHRDLKLDNIVLENQNDLKSIKIIDFGFAVEIGYQTQVRCGTPGYIAPEILNQEDYDELVDIYSLGSIFHSLLSGQKLYPEYQDKQHLIFLNKLNKVKVSSKIMDIEQRQLLLLMIGHKKHRPSASLCLKHQFFRKGCIIPHPIQLKLKIQRLVLTIENQVKQLCFPNIKNPFKSKSF